jgi:diguanylate cyclase (GGDEF)-like protein/PAS domain S-box-containing protein
MPGRFDSDSKRPALRLVMLYMAFTGLWFFVSGMLAETLLEVEQASGFHLGKALLFFTVPAVVLYVLLRRHERALRQAICRDADQLRRKEAELELSLNQRAAILRNIPDPAWLKDREGRYVAVNEAFSREFGLPANAVVGKTDLDLFPHEAAETYRADDFTVMDEGRSKRMEALSAGRWLETVKAPVYDREGGVVGTTGISRDITDKKLAQEKASRLARLYAILLQANQAIMRRITRQQLFEDVCRLAVSQGKFRAAFIRVANGDPHQVQTGFFEGGEEASASLRLVTDSDLLDGPGPTGKALREGLPAICNDFLHCPEGEFWRSEGLRHGVRAVAAFPLSREGRVVGAMTLYAGEVQFFDPLLVDLLQEMAVSLSFAQDSMEQEAKRLEAETALRQSESRFRTVVETVPGILYTASLPDFATTYISPAVERLLGYGPQAFIDDPQFWFKCIYEEDQDIVRAQMASMLACEAKLQIMYRVRHKDGSTLRWFSDSFATLCGADGTTLSVIGVRTDISDRVRMEDALKDSEDRFHELFNTMHSAVAIYEVRGDGEDFVFRNVNPSLERIEGMDRHDLLGKRLQEVFPAAEEFGLLEALRRVWRSGQAEHKAADLYRDERVVSWRESDIFRLPSGEVVTVYDDVSERMEALEKLKLDAKVFEESAEGIMVTDGGMRIISVNRMFSEITGYSEAEALGQKPSLLRSNRHDRSFYQNLWAAIELSGRWVGEIWNRRKNGEIFPAWMAISAVRDEQGRMSHYIGIFTDISLRKEAEERIRHLTHYDALTDLPNQFMLLDHIELALAQARRNRRFVAVMAVNLDRFREVNEHFGHFAGDQVLQVIGKRLAGLMREGDTVARLGADNFAIVMPDLDDSQLAVTAAGKVLEAVRRSVRVNGYELNLTARLGIALYPPHGEQAETLVKHADIALSGAKAEGGGNYVFYTQEQSRELEEMLALENALRHAIERDELRLHYQPHIDLRSGEIVAMEALLRWQHPQEGLLSPARFLPIAEQCGLILPIGEWVLQEASRQAREWHDAGFVKLRMAVNMSILQFRQRDLVEKVQAAVEAAGLNPVHLELEFTETFLMENREETADTLRRLRDFGLRFVIDDFGTGHSSLSFLKLFPIDLLKINQEFIRDIAFNPADAAIVQGMIALGHSLKLKMVAKGVETEAQMNYLRSIHCDEMQGFLYSQALPPAEALTLLQSSKRLQDIAQMAGAARKLLIVDDEPHVITALQRLLRGEGYHIFGAADAREALEILAVTEDIGVVLTDQRMPGMSGIELLSQVKVLYPTITRLVLSGYTEVKTITEAINRGEVYKFITKPWEDEELRENLREAFLRHEMTLDNGKGKEGRPRQPA